MATYAENLAEVERLNQCGSGFTAIVADPGVDEIRVKDPTPDTNCDATVVQAWKAYHGGQAEIGMSVEPDSL